MNDRTLILAAGLLSALFPFAALTVDGQSAIATLAATAPTPVPALIPYTFSATGPDGKPLHGESSVTFLLFKEEAGGQPLWTETQMVASDAAGLYAVKLGAASPSGIPLEIFADGTARWLEVQLAGQKPQPRVLLATVPYAAKAADAATLGGLPASAFALAGTSFSSTAQAAAAAVTPDANSTVTTPGGSNGYIPKFTGSGTIANSEIYDTGTSVGIGKVPSSGTKLDVDGTMIMRGNMQVTRTSNATSSKAYPSYGFQFYSNLYNSSTKAADNPYFQLQSEPTGNNTSSPSATFNLLFANNGAAIAETGFYFNPTGTIHFAPSQTFPGTVTSVGISPPISDFDVTSGAVTGSGTLSFAWAVAPTSQNVGNAIVKRDSNGGFAAGAINADSVAANTLTVYGQSYMAGANLAGPVGIGTNSPAAQLNLNANNAANADALLLGSTSRGMQLRDNGTGVDIESLGSTLNLNYQTGEPTYINANGGAVVINDNRASTGDPSQNGDYAALIVGTVVRPDGNSLAATFEGRTEFLSDVYVIGNLQVYGSKDFRIDHPVYPENKYLIHAAIESSEVLNQYSGNITTDELGLATVHLPDWFEVENTDFRYQLTVIGGQFAQAIISKKVANNQFTIGTNAPHVEVSWQVTAKRNDPYMKAHPFVVEEQKPAYERGTYIHPELFGQPESKRTGGPHQAKPQAPSIATLAPK